RRLDRERRVRRGRRRGPEARGLRREIRGRRVAVRLRVVHAEGRRGRSVREAQEGDGDGNDREVIAAKRIYDPPSASDGRPALIMRLWPRGIRKSRVDVWLKELGPILPLMRAFRGGQIGWAEYRRRYLAGLKRPEAQAPLAEVRAAAKTGTVTLFCGCPDESRCHRSLLRGYLLDSPRRPGPHAAQRSPRRGTTSPQPPFLPT